MMHNGYTATLCTSRVYVPVVSDEVSTEIGERTDSFHHILFGGDMLTARGSQYIRSNSIRGLQPVCEDWHCKMCLLGVSTLSCNNAVY